MLYELVSIIIRVHVFLRVFFFFFFLVCFLVSIDVFFYFVH